MLFRSHPRDGEFQLTSGEMKTVQMLDSGIEKFLHANTESFEAIELPCGRSFMIAVLPQPGVKIQELEHILGANPDMLDKAMHASYGSVTLPIFEIKTTMQLAGALKGMGLDEIFQNLDGVFKMPQSKINDVGQTIDFAVDKHGIRANAETVIGTIPLGILVDPHAFRISLNRPFLFFVRDFPTNALLFAGAVMDEIGRAHV